MSIAASLYSERGLTLLRQFKLNLNTLIRLLRRRPRAEPVPEVFPRTARVLLAATVTLVIVVPIVTVAADAWSTRMARTLPVAVHDIFGVITEFGKSGWLLWPIGVVLIGLGLVAGPSIGRVASAVVAALAVRLTFVFAAIAVPGLFTAIIKRMIGRARPFADGSADPYLYDPFVWKVAYAGLPSGHATTAFAAAVAIGAVWPQARPYLWCYAVLIAISRVVVLAHYPSDVIAGAVVGVVGAILVRDWFAARRLAFTLDAGGAFRGPPTPSWQRVKALAHRLGAA